MLETSTPADKPRCCDDDGQITALWLVLRVIEEGVVSAGDDLVLLDRPQPEWTVSRVIGLLIAGAGKQDLSAVAALAALPVLADNWRARAAKMAGR